MSDFSVLMAAQKDTATWKAERENASARLELAQIHERMAYLMSQHQPVASSGVDREQLRLLLAYLRHGSCERVERELLAQTGHEHGN